MGVGFGYDQNKFSRVGVGFGYGENKFTRVGIGFGYDKHKFTRVGVGFGYDENKFTRVGVGFGYDQIHPKFSGMGGCRVGVRSGINIKIPLIINTNSYIENISFKSNVFRVRGGKYSPGR